MSKEKDPICRLCGFKLSEHISTPRPKSCPGGPSAGGAYVEVHKEPPKFKHCDDYIHDFSAPMCLRFFLLVHRLPAIDGALLRANGVEPVLYATYEGTRVRIVMASRFGDVGITEHLNRTHGYEMRVHIEELKDFDSKA